MKDKILFLMEGLIDIGIATSLQERHDCEIYGLIDTNKYVKKFFVEQQAVRFQKVWYYRDHILKLNQDPDFEYLKNFENRYGINLWLIAYGDRIFYGYNDYYKFKRNEIISVLEQECRLFENILDEIKPDFAIIKSPDYNQSQLLYELCKARSIKILTLSMSRLGSRYIISEKSDKIDNYSSIVNNYSNSKIMELDELRNYLKGYSEMTTIVKNEHRASLRKKLKASLRYLVVVCNNDYRKYYVNFGRTRIKILINEGLLFLKKLYRDNFINRQFLHEIDKNDKFVFFPLHFEPERATLIEAPFYKNQLEVIENIARSLPIDYYLYVKEHPVQVVNGWRNTLYYKKILKMPNVKLLHPSASTEDILKNCSLVIVITGTLGLEAAFYNKPTIVFGDVIYADLPSVYRVKHLDDLPNIIRSALTKKTSLFDLNKFVHCIVDNSFEYEGTKFDAMIHNKFFYGGFLFDVEVSPQEVLSVIRENKSTFDNLSDAYIKKINQYNKQNI